MYVLGLVCRYTVGVGRVTVNVRKRRVTVNVAFQIVGVSGVRIRELGKPQ